MQMFEKKLQQLCEEKCEEVGCDTEQSGHRALRRRICDFGAELKSQRIDCVEGQTDGGHQHELEPDRAKCHTKGESCDAQHCHNRIDHKAQLVHLESVENKTDQEGSDKPGQRSRERHLPDHFRKLKRDHVGEKGTQKLLDERHKRH